MWNFLIIFVFLKPLESFLLTYINILNMNLLHSMYSVCLEECLHVSCLLRVIPYRPSPTIVHTYELLLLGRKSSLMIVADVRIPMNLLHKWRWVFSLFIKMAAIDFQAWLVTMKDSVDDDQGNIHKWRSREFGLGRGHSDKIGRHYLLIRLIAAPII